MERIGVVGVSWKRGGTQPLARFTIPADERAARLPGLARQIGAEELCYLATCNRVEFAFVGEDRVPMDVYRERIHAALAGAGGARGSARQTLNGWTGEGAVEHLCLVTAGLDSARVGETEITGQVRAARDLARTAGTLGPELEQVFEEALRLAAEVRGTTAVGVGHVSLAEIALAHVRTRLDRWPGPVAVVGVSELTERFALTLAREGHPVVIVNRTLSRAEELAHRVGATARALDCFRVQPDAVEAVLLATGAPDPVLGRPELERLAARAPSGEAPLLVDLALPPDVEPDTARRAGVPRVGLDQVLAEAGSTEHLRRLELADCRCLIDDALVRLRRRRVDRDLAPLLAALQLRYRQTAVEGIERLFRRELTGLDETQREAVKRWAETLARRFAHLPTEGLKHVAFDHGVAAVRGLLTGSDAKLAHLLEPEP